jgi:hypothetical protein
MKKLTASMKAKARSVMLRRERRNKRLALLHDNPGYIEINMGANRHERRSAAAMNRKFDRAS